MYDVRTWQKPDTKTMFLNRLKDTVWILFGGGAFDDEFGRLSLHYLFDANLNFSSSHKEFMANFAKTRQDMLVTLL